MFIPVDCSQCGKPFQVPEAAVGKPSACPWCHATVLALPLASPPPSEASPQPSSVTNDKETFDAKEKLGMPASRKEIPSTEPLSLDDEPSTQPSPKRDLKKAVTRSRSPFYWIVAVVVGLVVMAATTALTLTVLQYKQGHWVSMEWQPFAAPDGSCAIDLLGKPTETDSDPEHGERRYISEGWYSGTTAWIGWRSLTQAQTQEASAKDGWVQFRKFFFDKEQARLKEKFGGYVARDATIEQNPITVEERLDGQNGAVIERMIIVPNGANRRIYFIGMAGKRLDLDGPVVKRFFDSFRVLD
jgi:hypothetical protein